MATTRNIEAALAVLRAADKPNISAVAKEYNIERTRLGRLYKGQITIWDDYVVNCQLLSPQQNKTLLQLVKRLTSDGLPPTPKMVRQFAKDLTGSLPGRNWPHRWLKRNHAELQSDYLKGFDLARKKADSFW